MLRLQVAGIMQGLSCPCTFWCFPYWVMQVLQVLQVVLLGNRYPSRVPEVLDTFPGLPGVPAARTDTGKSCSVAIGSLTHLYNASNNDV